MSVKKCVKKQKSSTQATQTVKDKSEENKKTKRKKSRRSRDKLASLKSKYTLKSRQEFLDTEYINGVYDQDGNQVIRPLDQKEKEWLAKFYTEDLNASFNHEDPLYDTPEQRRASYARNNARNRDIYNKSKSMGILYELNDESYSDPHKYMLESKDDIEEATNKILDKKIKDERGETWFDPYDPDAKED